MFQNLGIEITVCKFFKKKIQQKSQILIKLFSFSALSLFLGSFVLKKKALLYVSFYVVEE